MNQFLHRYGALFTLSTPLILTACGGGGSTETTTSEAISGLQLPERVDVVAAESSSARSAAARFAGRGELGLRFDDAGSDYANASTDIHTYHPAIEPVNTANEILCFISQMRADQFVDQGAYIALVDDDECSQGESGASSQNQSSGQNATNYTEVIIDSTRASNEDPMIVNVWIPEMEGPGNSSMLIKARAEVTAEPSATNPMGEFQLTWQMIDSSGTSFGSGEISTAGVSSGLNGFTFFESMEDDFGFGPMQIERAASVEMQGETTGQAITRTTMTPDPGGENATYRLSYDADFIIGSQDSLTPQVCLDRNNIDETVWSYDLFDYTSGATLSLNSGLSFTYDGKYGHVGYWGLWYEDESANLDGATVSVFDYSSDTQTDYTLQQTPGRLIRNEVKSLAISALDGIQFEFHDEQNPLPNNADGAWLVEYFSVSDGVASDGFYRTGYQIWQQDAPPVVSNLDTPVLVSFSPGQNTLHMWSSQLGGSVRFVQGDNEITYDEQTIMNGSETGAGELFASGGSATLYCLDRCLVPGSPMSTSNPNSVAEAVAYSINNDSSAANFLTLVHNASGNPVDGTDPANLPAGSEWGIDTGAMLTDISALANVWDVYELPEGSVYYTWETGPNNWNRTTTVFDSLGVVQSFDKPIEFTYTHSDANDRSGSAVHDTTDYAGQTFRLNYGGSGDFWGIPEESLDTDGDGNPDRWTRAFAIADGVQMGPNGTEYAIKARDVEQTFVEVDISNCSALSLTEPATALPSTVSGTLNDLPVPTVTSAPKVIGGEIQE